MKVKLFIVSLFILISIFNIEMGNHYMSLWLQIIIEIISVFITVYSLLYFISNSKKEIESQILSLKDIFSKNFEEIKSLNIRQKTEIVDILNTYSKDILKQIYDTNERLSVVISSESNQIKDQLSSSEKVITKAVETCTNSAFTTLAGLIENLNKVSHDRVESLRQLSKEQHEVLLQRVDGVSQQGEVIQKNICSSVSDLSSKSDALGESITLVSNSINEHISSTDKKMLSIEKQNSSIVEHITAKEKDCSISKAILSDIKNQYEVLNKNVTSIQFKAQSIEESVNLLSEDKLDSKIIDSIGTLISEFQATYKSSVSDVNNTLLDTQIAQEATTNELEKLQILLRTLLNSFDENSAKNVSEEPKAVNLVVKNSMPSSEKTSEYKNVPRSQIQKRQTQAKTSTPIGITQNPNRTENILDNETGNLVINQYKDGKVVKSTMKDSKGHIMYELEYVNERIVRSRNFNNKGQLNVEQTFYANGQVHYRNEYTPNGRITTEFDFNGKKK